MAQSDQVWVRTLVFTGTMYQHQDVLVEKIGGRVDWAIREKLYHEKLSKRKQV